MLPCVALKQPWADEKRSPAHSVHQRLRIVDDQVMRPNAVAEPLYEVLAMTHFSGGIRMLRIPDAVGAIAGRQSRCLGYRPGGFCCRWNCVLRSRIKETKDLADRVRSGLGVLLTFIDHGRCGRVENLGC